MAEGDQQIVGVIKLNIPALRENPGLAEAALDAEIASLKADLLPLVLRAANGAEVEGISPHHL